MGKILSVLVLVLVVLSYGLLIGGCRKSETLPPAARQTIDQRSSELYTDSYQGETGFDRITDVNFSHAWRAQDLPEGVSGPGGEAQVWCVELEVTGERQGEVVSEQPVWVAIQQEPGADWNVQPLVLFSASWPYESCGRAPGY